MTQAMVLEESRAEWFEDARFMIERLAASNDQFTPIRYARS